MSLRELLPQRRLSETFTLPQFGAQNTEFIITLGYYPDGRVGEVFITGPKAGTAMASLVHDGAVLVSLAIQHGVPLPTIQHALSREADGKAATIIGTVVDKVCEIEKERA